FDLLRKMQSDYASATIDETRSPSDKMVNTWYFSVGRSAVDVVMQACMASTLTEVRTVLDLPCGYGRVLRHLVALFPRASFAACDVDREAVEFCASTFGAKPL